MSEQGIGSIIYAVGRTDTGRVRPANEDAFVISDLSAATEPRGPRFEVGDRGVLLAVSDGMGGAEAGEVASAIVVESLRDHLDDTCRESDMLEAVKCAVALANRDVVEAAREPGRAGMGATLVAVVVHHGYAHIASVGDSRVYLVRNGGIHRMTKDQSFVETLVASGAMTREQAERSPYRNVILQAMGQRPEITADIGRIELRRGDVLLLCSDGLSGKLTDEEMLGVAAEGPSHEQACTRLVELANERGGEDNITVVLAEVAGLELQKPAPTEDVAEALETVQEFDPSH